MSQDGELDETAPSSRGTGLLPSTVSRFAVERELGRGGMGVVLLAEDPDLGRKVAIKMLRGDLDEAARRRFLREAQAMAKLAHEHVAIVHEVGTDAGRDYVAMEYVAGTTLGIWQIGRPWRDVIEVYAKAGRGLAAAHAAGLVHRDFKPENVLIGEDGRVRVSDFGLVAAGEGAGGVTDAGMSLTQTGAVMGTPRYMAPEQHLGDAIDARADEFAFCVALYEALYAQRPFAGNTLEELAASVCAGELRPAPVGGALPRAVGQVLARGMARDREARFASMEALLAALATATAPRPRRRWWIAVPVVAVLAGGGVLAYELHAARARAEALEVQLKPLASVASPVAHAGVEFKAAEDAYKRGDFEKAAMGFLAAYEFDHTAEFLYNAAAAYHSRAKATGLAADYDRAIEQYRRYLEAAPDAHDRVAIEQVVARLVELRDAL